MTNPILTSISSRRHEVSRRGHGRVTLADVAEHAGVTTMTISRYLRSPERVSAVTARKISDALLHTGYSPNLQAGSLASGRSLAVAVIVPNLTHSIFADSLHGLGETLQAKGLHMLVSSTGYSLSLEEQQVRTVLGWAPAAVVVTGRLHTPATEQLLFAAQVRGTPIVEMWDQSPAHEPHRFQQIGFDHSRVGAAMAQALIERGYRRLCFIDTGVEDDFRAHERAEGFLGAAQTLGIRAEHWRASLGDPIVTGAECFSRWHEKQPRPILCGIGFANDLLGTGALLAAKRLGCVLPGEVGMLGFGDFPVGRYCAGGLSTMHIDGERIGQACAEYITQHLHEGRQHQSTQVGQVVLQPRLMWRGL